MSIADLDNPIDSNAVEGISKCIYKGKRSVQNRPSGSSHKSSKHWVIITTKGERFEFIGGLVDFCKEHSFRYETIAKIANGFIPIRGKYKGWKVSKSAVS